LVQPYLKSVRVDVCSSFTGKLSFGGSGKGYGYNGGWLGSQYNNPADQTAPTNYFDNEVGSAGGIGPPVTDSQITAPAHTIALADAGYISLRANGDQPEKVAAISIDNPSQMNGIPSIDYRHIDSSYTINTATQTVTENGLANAFYCDGHMGVIRQSTTTDAMFNPTSS
ncbi:MAG: prepilin-type N-terminal cleavage/methylation domain, partial [Capsulimonas sp.]|nr:prepilin-type N-terminal cleavage/methylation domain [Capsulimonas sp.]